MSYPHSPPAWATVFPTWKTLSHLWLVEVSLRGNSEFSLPCLLWIEKSYASACQPQRRISFFFQCALVHRVNQKPQISNQMSVLFGPLDKHRHIDYAFWGSPSTWRVILQPLFHHSLRLSPCLCLVLCYFHFLYFSRPSPLRWRWLNYFSPYKDRL